MKLYKFRNILPSAMIALSALGFTACSDELHVENKNPQQVTDFNQSAIFNKVYANMVLTGQTGPAGNQDIANIDEGTSSMIRQIWNANELTTDEAHCRWGDAGIPEFNHNAWTDSHPMMQALYYRLMFGVTMSNYFLEQATGTDAETLQERAEVRFMRCLYYYYLMDLYGNPPFITTVSTQSPSQISRADLFTWIESELKAVDGEDASSTEVLADKPSYGRAPKAAAWLLLSRMYLNAQVYTGTAHWQEAKDYAQRVINDSNYGLCTTPKNGYSAFQLLFMGDNDTNGAEREILLPAIHDGETTQTWGGCLFVVASTTDAAIVADYPTGTSENWEGNSTRRQFAEKFFPNDDAPQGTPTQVAASAGDDRALFYTKDHTVNITDESSFKSGYAYVKFLNVHSDGSTPHHTQFVDTDFPMLRVGEAYLNYAEADARLNNGTVSSDGLNAIKTLRSRANASTNFTQFSLSQIEDEWSREFGFEGMRRTVLVRFGHFGGQSDYRWEYEGGVANGASFPAYRNIFALPASDLNANGNLTQNPGY